MLRALRALWQKLLRFLGITRELPLAAPAPPPAGPQDPDDPYSFVGAPKKPRPPQRQSAIAQEPPEDLEAAGGIIVARRI